MNGSMTILTELCDPRYRTGRGVLQLSLQRDDNAIGAIRTA